MPLLLNCLDIKLIYKIRPTLFLADLSYTLYLTRSQDVLLNLTSSGAFPYANVGLFVRSSESPICLLYSTIMITFFKLTRIREILRLGYQPLEPSSLQLIYEREEDDMYILLYP